MKEKEQSLPKSGWEEHLLEIAGTEDVTEAAKILADQEVAKILRMRGWDTFESGVPLLDFLCTHPDVYPLFGPVVGNNSGFGEIIFSPPGQEDERYHILLNTGIHSPALNPVQFNYTLAHEFGHVVLGDLPHLSPDNLSIEDRVQKGREREAFCDIFARHFILPDRVGIPKLRQSFDLETISRLVDTYGLSPDSFVDWCGDNINLLESQKKAVIGDWKWSDKWGSVFTTDYVAELYPCCRAIPMLSSPLPRDMRLEGISFRFDKSIPTIFDLDPRAIQSPSGIYKLRAVCSFRFKQERQYHYHNPYRAESCDVEQKVYLIDASKGNGYGKRVDKNYRSFALIIFDAPPSLSEGFVNLLKAL